MADITVPSIGPNTLMDQTIFMNLAKVVQDHQDKITSQTSYIQDLSATTNTFTTTYIGGYSIQAGQVSTSLTVSKSQPTTENLSVSFQSGKGYRATPIVIATVESDFGNNKEIISKLLGVAVDSNTQGFKAKINFDAIPTLDSATKVFQFKLNWFVIGLPNL